MRFLFPGFLFALLFIAIPVIIHLFNFRKFKKVYFSNVSFLKEIQHQTSSSRNLKNLLLLIARILTIIFLVFAFARPYIPEREDSGNQYEQNAVSIYIDNSYSMETLNKEGSLLDEAKRRAREIASAYSINNKYQLLTNDFEGKHQRLLSYEDFIKAVDDVKISSLNKNLQQIISRQQDVFASEPNTEKAVYVISDFQRNFLPVKDLEIDSAIALRFVRLEANELANISVDSVWFVSPVHRTNETEKLVVQLKNNSDKRAENIPIKVLIDGKPKALGSLNVEARNTSKDTLSFSGLNPGWKRGEVAITDYPVVFDDNFFFSFNVRQRMPVLSIFEQAENPYINALYKAESFFNYQAVSSGSIDYSRLAEHPLIILTATENTSAGLATQLKTYVQNGGSLMIFPSTEPSFSGLSTLTQTLGTEVPQAILSQETKVTSINLQHPIFKGVFSQLPNKLDLPVAKKAIRYSNSSRSSRQSILQFADGRGFFSHYSVGKGKVYLSAVALSEESGNFVRHSVFVPLMYQAAFLSLRDNRLFYTLGKDQFLEMNKITLSANQTLKLKKGNFEAIPDMRSSDKGTRLFISDQIKEKGLYQLLKGDSILSVFAFNDNRLESDLSYLTKSDLKSKIPNGKVDIFNPGKGSIQNAIKAVNNGLQLWKLCLILALVFLAIEILLARFYKAKESKLKI
ncbi:MAG: BatA domain-containing protein [Sphingobacteriaceae bacterium]|nr:BatA domain-containing protein [Sphingobacteriaceae bacterium]